jgi:hypothetical protein
VSKRVQKHPKYHRKCNSSVAITSNTNLEVSKDLHEFQSLVSQLKTMMDESQTDVHGSVNLSKVGHINRNKPSFEGICGEGGPKTSLGRNNTYGNTEKRNYSVRVDSTNTSHYSTNTRPKGTHTYYQNKFDGKN